tara:strand:- start:356 stop:979 length:624 start_codon:yes stop_codon:yes gene_type:complete
MVYKNFIIRSLSSLLFFFIYIIIVLINFNLVFYLILFIYFFVFIEIYFNFKKFKLLPIIYLIISLFFSLIVDFDHRYILYFNLFIFAIITFDVFSYIIGQLFGKNQLTLISPNKTVEGLIGGIIFGFTFCTIFTYYFIENLNTKIIIFIIFTILFAFLGDIIESYFKRKNNLKNSSKLIPGHGGFFDRFDSFVFSIIFYSIFINYIV